MSFNRAQKYSEFQIVNNTAVASNLGGDLVFDKNIDKVYTVKYSVLREFTGGLIAGKPEVTFNENSGLPSNFLSSPTGRIWGWQSTGKIVFIGNMNSLAFPSTVVGNIARFYSNGLQDTTFNTSTTTGISTLPTAMMVQSDDKLIICGPAAMAYAGVIKGGLIRLNADGTLDTAFMTNLGTGALGGAVNNCFIQADGKIVIGGGFTTVNGVSRTRIARINADGTLDTAFNTAVGLPSGQVRAIWQQTDGKLIVAGSIATWGGLTRGGVVRLNTDGTEDTAFATAVGVGAGSAAINQAQVDPSQKIVLGISGGIWKGSAAQNYVVRLLSTGADDTAFTTALGATDASGLGVSGNDCQILSDNSILIAKSRNAGLYGGVVINGGLVKLTPTGAVDTTFNTLYNGWQASFLTGRQGFYSPDLSAVFCVGSISSYNGAVTSGIVKLRVTTANLKTVSQGVINASYSDTGAAWSITNTNISGMVGYDPYAGAANGGFVMSILPGGQMQYTSSNISSGTKVNDRFRYRVDPL